MALNLTAAYAVADISAAGEPRRAAATLAERFGFTPSRSGQAALIVSELASNLAKHAKRGEILLRPICAPEGGGEVAGLEILAIDSGPGIPDVALSRRDGYSTTGTLGHGLGAIARQSDLFDVFTDGSGTVAVAQIWRERPAANPRHLPYEIGAAQVAHAGEDICGDDWDWRMRDGRLTMILADGLGHGLSAHDAARAATLAYRPLSEEAPQRIVEQIHASLRATRGAAVATLSIDCERGVARYCGVGNISAVILPPDGRRQSMVSQNGTAGHTASRIHEFNYPVPSRAIVVMASDGLGTHWDLGAYPGLRAHHPSVIAGLLYRDFSRRRDDVTVVVAKGR